MTGEKNLGENLRSFKLLSKKERVKHQNLQNCYQFVARYQVQSH